MARPREFEIDQALADALDVFWTRGYSETTLPDLLAGMKLTRGSFYKAFKDKKSLFLSILSAYDEQEVDGAVAFLGAPERDGWNSILGLFSSVVAAVSGGDRRGCLLCTTLADPGSYDADIVDMAQASLERMRRAFEDALKRSHLSEQANEMSHLLAAQYVGLRLLARTELPAAQLEQNVKALEAFGP